MFKYKKLMKMTGKSLIQENVNGILMILMRCMMMMISMIRILKGDMNGQMKMHGIP